MDVITAAWLNESSCATVVLNHFNYTQRSGNINKARTCTSPPHVYKKRHHVAARQARASCVKGFMTVTYDLSSTVLWIWKMYVFLILTNILDLHLTCSFLVLEPEIFLPFHVDRYWYWSGLKKVDKQAHYKCVCTVLLCILMHTDHMKAKDVKMTDSQSAPCFPDFPLTFHTVCVPNFNFIFFSCSLSFSRCLESLWDL